MPRGSLTLAAGVRADQAAAGLLAPRAALELTVDMLKRVAAACPSCTGKGRTCEPVVAFLLTDDRRRARSRIAARARLLKVGPEVDPIPRGGATLVSECQECREVRQVIETAGRSL